MKRWFNISAQIVAIVAQATSALTPILSPKGKIISATAIGVLQAIIGVLAHEFNPDGTDARTPYEVEPE